MSTVIDKLKIPPPTYLFELKDGNYRFNLQRQDERVKTQFEGETHDAETRAVERRSKF